jgi:hypothetical protein
MSSRHGTQNLHAACIFVRRTAAAEWREAFSTRATNLPPAAAAAFGLIVVIVFVKIFLGWPLFFTAMRSPAFARSLSTAALRLCELCIHRDRLAPRLGAGQWLREGDGNRGRHDGRRRNSRQCCGQGD